MALNIHNTDNAHGKTGNNKPNFKDDNVSQNEDNFPSELIVQQRADANDLISVSSNNYNCISQFIYRNVYSVNGYLHTGGSFLNLVTLLQNLENKIQVWMIRYIFVLSAIVSGYRNLCFG